MSSIAYITGLSFSIPFSNNKVRRPTIAKEGIITKRSLPTLLPLAPGISKRYKSKLNSISADSVPSKPPQKGRSYISPESTTYAPQKGKSYISPESTTDAPKVRKGRSYISAEKIESTKDTKTSVSVQTTIKESSNTNSNKKTVVSVNVNVSVSNNASVPYPASVATSSGRDDVDMVSDNSTSDKAVDTVTGSNDSDTVLGQGLASLGQGLASLGQGLTSLGQGLTSLGQDSPWVASLDPSTDNSIETTHRGPLVTTVPVAEAPKQIAKPVSIQRNEITKPIKPVAQKLEYNKANMSRQNDYITSISLSKTVTSANKTKTVTGTVTGTIIGRTSKGTQTISFSNSSSYTIKRPKQDTAASVHGHQAPGASQGTEGGGGKQPKVVTAIKPEKKQRGKGKLSYKIYNLCSYSELLRANLFKSSKWTPEAKSVVDYSDNDAESPIKNTVQLANMMGHKLVCYTLLKDQPFIPKTYMIKNKRFFGPKPSVKEASVWFLKNAMEDGARDIKLLSDPNESLRLAEKGKTYVLQPNIDNPSLIVGRKFDLRIYVLYICNNGKVEVYIYRDGLCRVSGSSYDKDSTNRFVQITNTNLQVSNSRYNADTCRLLFSEWDKYDIAYPQIKNIVKKCSKIIVPHMKFPPDMCFLITGYDILVDKNDKAWLIEINISPTLRNRHNPKITNVIHRVIHGIFVMGIQRYYDSKVEELDDWELVTKV